MSSPQAKQCRQPGDISLAVVPMLTLVLALSMTLLTGCGGEDSDESSDVIDTEEDVASCVCDNGCPADMCDVRVVLDANCAGKLEEATVTVDGMELGTATLDEPFTSCQAWSCDSTLTLQVDGENFTTGPRMLSVALDPDVPLSCENL